MPSFFQFSLLVVAVKLNFLQSTNLACFKLLSLEEYVKLVVDFIERLPKDTVIQRITGEAPQDLLIAPSWCSHKEKMKVIELIRKEFEERNTFQGAKCRF